MRVVEAFDEVEDRIARVKRERSARAREDETLQQRIEVIHRDSRQTYGVPRIHAELQEEGTKVGRKRIARLMKASASEFLPMLWK